MQEKHLLLNKTNMKLKEYLKLKRLAYISVIDFLIDNQEIDNWQIPYFRTRYNNGEFFEDFNPIISFANFQNNLIVKISHDEDLVTDFESWISNFDDKKVLNIEINIKNFDIIKCEIYNFINHNSEKS